MFYIYIYTHIYEEMFYIYTYIYMCVCVFVCVCVCVYMKVKRKSLSCVQLFGTPWTVAYQAPPPSMGFSRQEYWTGLPFPSPGNFPYSGFEPRSSTL